jgi:hypothetical protein
MIEKIMINRLMGRKIKLVNGRETVCNVVAMLKDEKTGKMRYIPGANVVTNDGDQYYAEAAVGSPSWAVAGMRLGTGGTAPSKTDTDVTTFLAGSGKAIDGTYPQTNDGDSDNTGAGIDIVTWRVSYGTGEANGSGIQELAIVDNISAPTKALTHALFAASFSKTSSDTLKVFVNHTFNGV